MLEGFLAAVSLAAVVLGCGNGLRSKILAYDADSRKAVAADKAEMDKLVVELVDATKADSQEVIRLYRTDPDSRVRSTCATFLWLSDIKEAAPALADGARSDSDGRVSTLSIDALARLLGSFPKDTTVQSAAKSAAESDLARRPPAGLLFDAEIAARLNDREAVGLLAAALPEEKPALYTAGVRAIALIGGSEAMKALADLKKHAKDQARLAFIDGLLAQMQTRAKR